MKQFSDADFDRIIKNLKENENGDPCGNERVLMNKIGSVSAAMIAYYQGEIHSINHFLKVYGFAKTIGEKEELDPANLEILEVAALMHDIGIKVSLEKYQSSDGIYQQIEGPPLAKAMLTGMDYPSNFTVRVCWLIAHHHDYPSVRELDHQILVEADFLVNAYEQALSEESLCDGYTGIFKTQTGRELFQALYGMSG